MLTAVRPFPAGAVLELPLSVHTGGHAPFNGYNGYSTLVLIDAGAPLPDDLSLLRAYFWDVNGWRELDRVYGDADNDQKQFWFRSQTDLGNDITDTHYAFFVMATGTPPAKANQDNVWLFVDDFEGGLGKWGDGGSQWALGTNGGLTSTNNLTNLGNDAGTELTISPLVPLHERDVSVQSWWKSPNFDNVNAAQQLRVQPASAGATWLGHEVNKAGTQWQTATYAGPATYTYLANVSGGAMGQMQDGWSLVLLRMCGNLMEAQTPSGYWSQTLGSAFDAGTVSFRSSGSTHAPVMIDNVVVRRYACPEPQTSVLPSRTSP
jgi:hypothetical protein